MRRANIPGLIPYVLLLAGLLVTGNLWWLAGAFAWWVVFEIIL